MNEIRYENLSDFVISQAKMVIYNFVGGSIPASNEDLALAERRVWDEFGGEQICSVLGQKGKTSVIAAAGINSSMMQAYYEEDCHLPTDSHPSATVVPAALAVGQSVGASGKQVIEAVVAGIEGMSRVGKCLILPGFAAHGLRPAAINGTFGACIAAAKLLKLDDKQMTNALGLAGNYAIGFMEWTLAGTNDYLIQCSNGTRSGIIAAYEAKQGIQGTESILDGKYGLGCAFNQRPCDWSAMTKPIDRYEIEDIIIKAFPCCGHVLTTCQATMELISKRELCPADIRHITIGARKKSVEFPGCNSKGPYEGKISAMSSHQFMTAACIINKGIPIAAIKNYKDKDVFELAQKIDVVVDPEIDKTPVIGSRVTIEMKNGEILSNLQPRAIGLSNSGMKERLRSNAQETFPEEQIAKLADMLEKIETIENVGELANLMQMY